MCLLWSIWMVCNGHPCLEVRLNALINPTWLLYYPLSLLFSPLSTLAIRFNVLVLLPGELAALHPRIAAHFLSMGMREGVAHSIVAHTCIASGGNANWPCKNMKRDSMKEKELCCPFAISSRKWGKGSLFNASFFMFQVCCCCVIITTSHNGASRILPTNLKI